MSSLDDARRPDVQAQSLIPEQSIGVPGTAIFGGIIQAIEKDSRLTGRNRYKTFSDFLVNIEIIGAGVRYFLNLVAKAAWTAEPADESDEARRLADLVEDMMHDMARPWHRVIRRAAMYRFYGFSVQEWTAKHRDDGNMGMADIEPRPQITIERWDTERSGEVIAAIQRSPQSGEELPIPREKLVYMIDDSLSDSPEGLGLFRHIVDASKRLRRYQQLEGFGFENDLRGIPILRGPFTELAKMVTAGSITEEQKTALEQPLKDFLDAHIKNPNLGMMLDSQTWQTQDERKTPTTVKQWDIELLDGGTYSLAEIAKAITRIETGIARVLGVEHLILGANSAGSFALSKDKTQSFGLIIDSTLTELTAQFQKDFLGPIWKLNGWDEKLKPTLKTKQVSYRDIEQITGALRDLASAGVVLDRDDDLVKEVLGLLGLSALVPMLMNDPDMLLGGSPNKPKDDEDKK